MAGGKHLNVDLSFRTDTSQAQREIKNLQVQLDSLLKTASKSTGQFSLDDELKKASQAAIELKQHLEKATNVNTGKLDVGVLSRSFKQAGTSLEDYRIKLSKLGAEGNQVFASLAKAILDAEVPLRQTNTLLDNFATTLKNTARWQISSSVLHSFMGSLQTAYYYAEDLNESLNNIRIVTGKSTDEMAEFAQQANEAAKALSSTTTQYTDAALIYYQQGLSDTEVLDRTNVTIKMANVARESAEDVSQQMTAVWNNFDNGSKSLEYYADVITALGAATASSSSEITEGLEKFAAVANTVGLSYEYATAALATVTATTRQSADIVGNAFKTLFARLEGLNLGETLDDGTDLNKYSEALDKVGIQIKDTSGNMKNMDQILDEMGSKWNTLGKDQQIALAQTVAGVRQYTQLIALMDNWDFFQQNLGVAQGSEGALQEQAEIYAESWEAAKDRVTAAAEEIYNQLLDDDFFIGLNNSFADILDIISKTIDGIGGLKGALAGVGLLVTKLYGTTLVNTLNNFFTTQEQRQRQWIMSQEQALTQLEEAAVEADRFESAAAYESIIEATKTLVEESKHMTETQREEAELELKQLKTRAEAIAQYEEMAAAAEKELELAQKKDNLTRKDAASATDRKNRSLTFSLGDKENDEKVQAAIANYTKLSRTIAITGKEARNASTEFDALVKALDGDRELAISVTQSIDEESKALKKVEIAATETTEAENNLINAQKELKGSSDDLYSSAETLQEKWAEMQKPIPTMGEQIVNIAQGFMSLSMAISTIKGLGNIWSDEDMSYGEKVLSTITSLGIALPMVTASFKAFKNTVSSLPDSLLSFAANLKGVEVSELVATGTTAGLGTAFKEAAVSAVTFETALGPLGLVVLGVSAAFAGLIAIGAGVHAVYKNYTESLEKAAAEQESQAKTLKEQQDALVQTKDNIISVADAYEKLTKEVKSNAEFTTDLRTQVFDLCNQYELYDLAIETLTKDYDDLTDSIRQARIEQNKQIEESADKVQSQTQSAISSKVWSNMEGKQRDRAGINSARSIDLGIGIDNDLQGLLKQYNVGMYGFGHVDLDSFVKAATENHDEFVEALEKNGGKQAKTLIDILNENSELINDYLDSEAQATEAIRDRAGLENSSNISSYQDYAKAIKNIQKEVQDTFADEENPEESARKYAESWMAEFSKSSSEYAKKYALSESIAEALGQDLDSTVNKLSKYDSVSLAFIASHTEQIKQSEESLDSFITKVEDYLDIAGNIQKRDSVTGLLQSLATGEEYNKDELTNLLSEDSGFGMNQAEFDSLGKGQQTVALLNYFAENQNAINENKEKTIKELDNYRKEVENKIIEIDKEIEDIEKIEDTVDSYLKEGLSEDKRKDAFELIEKKAGGELLTQQEYDRLHDYTNSYSDLLIYINKYKKEIKEIKELEGLKTSRDNLNEEIDAYEAAAKSLEEAASATTKYKAAHEGIGEISKDIDSIQSAYSSLTSIVKTYNENNGFTLDSLQSLLALDPMYLQALEMDGNQLSINKEYLVELTKARLEETKALVYEEGYNKLLALAEKDATLAAQTAAIMQASAGESAENAGKKAETAAERWNKLTAAMGGSISAEAKTIINDTEKRIQSIDNVINNLNSSSFDKIAKTGKSSGSKKDKKILEDEIDRYYDLNNAIQKTTNSLEDYNEQLNRLKTYQDHYSGDTLIKSLKVQNELIKKQSSLLNNQIDNYKAYATEQYKELDELKAKIQSYGGTFTGDVLDNYTKVMTDAVNNYNSSIGNKDSSKSDNSKDIEKHYEKIKKALSRYQELYYTELAETQKKIEKVLQEQLENQLKVIANNLKSWKVEIELKLNTNNLKREWRDFIKGVEQDFRKVYKSLTIDSLASKDNFSTYLSDASTRIKQMSDIEAEIRKMESSKDANGIVQLSDDMIYGSISEAQDALRELQSELTNTGNSLKSLYEQIWNNYIDGLDQVANNFNDISKEIEHLTNKLEHQKQLIELIYGDKAYDLMNKYYEAQQKNIGTQINSTRTQALFWEEQLNKAYQMNKNSHKINLDDMSTWTEDMKIAYDHMIESQETLNELVIKGIETLRDEYLNNISKTLSEMDKTIWGIEFDKLKEDWDFIQKKAEEYLDNIEGAYKVQSLANKINQSIADTFNLKAQQKLAKLREDELEMLREKENLTQSDIDLAEARYQIALKEIALEDAQNNKTSMKLARDTSGNWTYQYVADEEDVMSKQQELLDAYNNLYTTADEAYSHAMELSMNMYEEYKEKILTIAEDITLTEEQKMIKIQELQDLYLPEIQAAMENAQIYEQETIMATAAVFSETCNQDAEAYTTLTDLQKELVDSVKEQHLEDYEEIREAIINDYQDINETATATFQETNQNSKTTAASIISQWDKNSNDSVKGAMNDVFASVQRYTQNFEQELYNLEKISGQAIMSAEGVVGDISAIGIAMDLVSTKTQNMTDKATSNLDTLRGFVNNVENAWNDVISKIQEAINELQKYLTLSEGVANASSYNLDINRVTPALTSTSNSSGKGSGGGSSSTNKKNQKTWSGANRYVVKDTSEGMIGIYDNMTGNFSSLMPSYYDISSLEETVKNLNALNRGQNKAPYSFSTGGYTGEWGSEGRMAILHQKELVLNQNDTKNMLSAVNAIRDIAGLNDSISQSIANSISQLVMKVIAANSGYGVSTTSNNNTNNVFNITAEFPNADDVQTIKDAILSLPNLASQFVYEN